MGIVGFALFIMGVVFIIIYPINKNKNKRCCAQTEGTLKKIFETDSSGGAGHAYLYSYCVNGVGYQLKSTAINKQVKNEGDKCTIWYNPAKPKEAQAFHYESNKVYTIILIIGIVMVLLGIILPILSIGLSNR